MLVLSLAALTLVGLMPPLAQAQMAPIEGQKVTITGLVDMLTNAGMNHRDNNFTRASDAEWYSRTRGRFDITGEVGKARAVLGIEIDSVFGQVSNTDNNLAGQAGTAAAGTANTQRGGTTSAFDLNTDTQGSIEIKWLYIEFPMPLMPFATRTRIGAQPFAVTYKTGVFATGDFAGLDLYTTWTPNVRSQITYVQIEERLHGASTGGSGGLTGFNRGDDFALILAAEVTPMKGLDIKPIYSYAYFTGATSAAARQAVGGIGGSPSFANKAMVGAPGNTGHIENRHTIGVDARWSSGPWSVRPTFFYQWGNRDTDNPFATPSGDLIREADISAWLFDVIAGYRLGPLLLEARYAYTSGNRPMDQLSKNVNYFQPINTDTTYGADGWGQIFTLGVDYLNGSIRGLGANIGFERYGRQWFGVKATYSVTPALDIYALAAPNWTARSVDTDGTQTAAGAITCATHSANSAANPQGAGCRGDETYLGTEANLGITWRFAPGLTFDLVGAYLFAGPALDISEVRNGVLTKREAVDAWLGTARVRFAF
jgi:hypothetical protein